MQVTPEDFRRHFELLSDAALIDIRREDLVDVAKQCLDDELSRRGLGSTKQINWEELSDRDGLVQIAKFHFKSDFELARALLLSESIPATRGNRIGRRIDLQIPLMVPPAFAQEALELLQSRVPDEELEVLAQNAVSAADAAQEEQTEVDPGPTPDPDILSR